MSLFRGSPPAEAPETVNRSEPGHYLTDGRELYRVVTPFLVDGPDPAAELEDCRTLGTRLYTAHELLAMGLRRIELEPALTLV